MNIPLNIRDLIKLVDTFTPEKRAKVPQLDERPIVNHAGRRDVAAFVIRHASDLESWLVHHQGGHLSFDCDSCVPDIEIEFDGKLKEPVVFMEIKAHEEAVFVVFPVAEFMRHLTSDDIIDYRTTRDIDISIRKTYMTENKQPTLWYMRDNHTFDRLTGNIEEILERLSRNFPKYGYGSLFSNGANVEINLHAHGSDWEIFKEKAAPALEKWFRDNEITALPHQPL